MIEAAALYSSGNPSRMLQVDHDAKSDHQPIPEYLQFVEFIQDFEQLCDYPSQCRVTHNEVVEILHVPKCVETNRLYTTLHVRERTSPHVEEANLRA